MKKKYKYYVVYQQIKNGQLGMGCQYITSPRKIDTEEELEDTVDFIKKNSGLEGVMIINLIKLRA